MLNLTESLFPQPTFSAYLGGSGILVGERTLQLLREIDPSVRDFVETFFIDSQEPRIDDHARARHYCYTDLGRFFEPVFEPFTATRFPENLGVTPVYNSSDGCGVTRIFGAASLAACLDDFADLLDDALGRLKARRRFPTQPLQVFLTASACGGTGAGMIIDAAALVRHFFREKGESPRIFLFLLGPEVYIADPSIALRSEQRDRMRASTYALLKELHHFADGGRFISSYRLRDEPLDIGNVADHDRLFEWVYLINDAGSVAEATEIIAETQLHLCLTEVGRKVAESMPNQREERVREYPLHFVHPDNQEQLSAPQRKQLRVAARKAFLASFSLRNVRFPAEELKHCFRTQWVRDCLAKALEREGARPGLALIDDLDRLVSAETDGGLFAELQLTREQLTAHSTEASQARSIPSPPTASATAETAIAATDKLLTAATEMLESMRANASGVRVIDAAVAKAVRDLVDVWERGLADDGVIAERLLRFAWRRAGGRGLRFLDALVKHAMDVLIRRASEAESRPNVSDLEEQIDVLRQHLASVRALLERERRTVGSRVRRLVASRMKEKPAESETLRKRTRSLVLAAVALRHEIVQFRTAAFSAAMAPAAWMVVAKELMRWRDRVVLPTIRAAENALTLADNEQRLARAALNDVSDDEMLAALSKRLTAINVEDLLLAPLQEEGISRELARLTIHTIRDLDRETIVSMLASHVERVTRQELVFLDDGWQVAEVAGRFRTKVPRLLDAGCTTRIGFSREEVGEPLTGYVLAPRRLLLPNPFGRRVDRLQRLDSRDPHTVSVVTFTFGVPPNALDGMRELFEQYTIHVGDPARHRGAHDRYPMHVFRNAAETFDEPYSPLYAGAGDDFMHIVVAAARTLWGDGGVCLDIRRLDINTPEDVGDWNRCVELTEKVLRTLCRWPAEAERLFRNGEFADLKRLYDSRRHPTDGNGDRPQLWMFNNQRPRAAGDA